MAKGCLFNLNVMAKISPFNLNLRKWTRTSSSTSRSFPRSVTSRPQDDGHVSPFNTKTLAKDSPFNL
jgi:hypothetical protein